MKFGIRRPSFKKRLAARTSWKRYVRHNLGFKAPRGWGWLTNPKRAAYNRVYNRTSVSIDRLFKGPRRRRAPRHDGAAIALVALVILVAAASAYLLVVGAVVFIAWLLRIATKKTTVVPTADSVIPAAAPDVGYQALVQTDADAFATEELTRTAARRVFDAWLKHVPKAPRRGADLVRDIRVRTRLIGRVTTQLVGRRFVWHSTPAPGRHPTSAPPLDPAALDPWNPPAGLTQVSRHFAKCWNCDGVGRTACIPCAGSGRIGCESCGGSGKYYGTAANGAQRLLNCKSCKGKGTITCAGCVRGTVVCSTCQKAKKLECWLEIEDHAREDVQVEPDGELTKAFTWGRDGIPASAEQIALDARVLDGIDTQGQLTAADLPPSVPSEWKHEHWARIQPHIDAGERAQAQSFRLLQVPSTEVTYALLGHHEVVSFEGLQMLAPPPWAGSLFARRASILGRVKIALAALPIAALIIYAARGSYFLEGRGASTVGAIVMMTTLVGIGAYATIWHATLGRKAARYFAGATALPALAAVVLIASAEPSIERARSLVRAGDLKTAKSELSAIGPESDASVAPVWADIHLREALSRRTCEEATKDVARIPTTEAEHKQAVEHADKLALTAARNAFAEGNTAAARQSLGCASSDTRRGAEATSLIGRIVLAESTSCISAKDWKCALSRVDEARAYVGPKNIESARTSVLDAVRAEVDSKIASARADDVLASRLASETDALGLWNDFLATPDGKQPPEIARLSTAKARDEKTLARQREADRKRAEAAERRRLAAEERHRRREEAAERRRAYRPLVCADGSLSPSCVCGGSWRGCCSHHGGVSGCRGD